VVFPAVPVQDDLGTQAHARAMSQKSRQVGIHGILVAPCRRLAVSHGGKEPRSK